MLSKKKEGEELQFDHNSDCFQTRGVFGCPICVGMREGERQRGGGEEKEECSEGGREEVVSSSAGDRSQTGEEMGDVVGVCRLHPVLL